MLTPPGPGEPAGRARRPRVDPGWIIVGVAGLAMLMASPGQTYVVSVFVDPMQRDTGWSRTLIAGLYTAGSLTAAVGVLGVGCLLDRHGARLVLSGVGIAFGLALWWMSRVEEPVELYVGFTLLRLLGQGALTLVPTTLVALWFVRRRARALSLAFLGAIVGQAAFPPLVQRLIARTDWRSAWGLLAVSVWLLLVPPAVLLVRRSPESVGRAPAGGPAGAAPPAPSPPGAGPGEEWTLAAARRTRTFWLLLLAGASHALITTALTFHHVAFLASRGLDAPAAAAVFTVMAPASWIGTAMIGGLADRVPGRHLLVAAQGLLVAAMGWSFAIGTPWQAVPYGVLLGLSNGCHATLQAVIWPAYFGRRSLGTLRSAATASTVAAAAVGPLPFAWLVDRTHSYSVAILILLALPIVSAGAAALAVPPRR